MRGSRRLATRWTYPAPVRSSEGPTQQGLREVHGRSPALPLRGGGPPALRAPPRPADSSFGATTSGARTPGSPYLHAFTRIAERLQAESASAPESAPGGLESSREDRLDRRRSGRALLQPAHEKGGPHPRHHG